MHPLNLRPMSMAKDGGLAVFSDGVPCHFRYAYLTRLSSWSQSKHQISFRQQTPLLRQKRLLRQILVVRWPSHMVTGLVSIEFYHQL